jgi:uncharacterized protein (DUF2236 family)
MMTMTPLAGTSADGASPKAALIVAVIEIHASVIEP